jgi:hypothetical protein
MAWSYKERARGRSCAAAAAVAWAKRVSNGLGGGVRAEPDRKAVRQGLGHAHGRCVNEVRWRPSPPARSGSISRSASAACRAAGGRDLRAGILGQDHADAAGVVAEGAEEGRHLRLHRRRARARSGLCRKLGVKVDDLLVSQPDTGEQALEITDMLVRSGAVDVVVVDSVAALTPKAEIEGEMGDQHPACRRG